MSRLTEGAQHDLNSVDWAVKPQLKSLSINYYWANLFHDFLSLSATDISPDMKHDSWTCIIMVSHKHITDRIVLLRSEKGKQQTLNEPAREIMALFILHKLILQMRMRSYPVGLNVWFLVWPFVYFHTSCVRTAKALARLHGCAGSPEPSLVAYVISTIISWAGSNCFVILKTSKHMCRHYQ